MIDLEADVKPSDTYTVPGETSLCRDLKHVQYIAFPVNLMMPTHSVLLTLCDPMDIFLFLSFGSFYLSRNLLISSKLSNLWQYSFHYSLIFLCMSMDSVVIMFPSFLILEDCVSSLF